MNKSSIMPRLGNYGIAALAIVNIVLWLIGLPANDGRPDFIRQIIAEMLSSTGMILMGCAIVLSLRLPVLEPFFGGLDRMYKSHKTAALTGLGLVILHFVLIPITGKSPLARDLGRIALAGFLILIALTLAPRVPVINGYIQLAYHQWKYTHRLVGAFFILGMIHAFNAPTLLYTAEPAASFWRVCVYAAAAAYVYKQLLAPLLARGAGYVVASVKRLNPSTVEVALKPDGAHVRQRAGQFAFVRFPGERGLGESHPFTVSSAPGEPHLRFTIKASGDWTKALQTGLREGSKARVHGAHGGFDFRAGGPRQIWVAGGIGVTPFLSWIRSLTEAPAQRIAFFYSVRAEPDAVFWDEFQAAAARFPNVTVIRNVSSTDGSLTLDKIMAGCAFDVASADVYLCGPPPMVLAFAAQFRAAGVPAGKIHYEEFNFR